MRYERIRLSDTVIDSGEFPESFCAAVGSQGFRMSQGGQPLSDKQRTDLTTLSRELQCTLSQGEMAGAKWGDPPVDGTFAGLTCW